MKNQHKNLAAIIDYLPEGIILMDKERVIHYLNDQAGKMTGWQPGDTVPYCTYCQQREISQHEERCILSVEESIPFFHSHMPVYKGLEEFEMSLTRMELEGELFFLLRITIPVQDENRERAKFNELLVQETMLAQEAERKKIARELHDHIGQSVYSIFLGLEVTKQAIGDGKYQSHVDNMLNLMEKTLSDIKHLTKSLRPEIVYHLGLKKSLRDAVRDWMKLYQIDIILEMNIDEVEEFDPEKELHLFRVIQESVSNAVRHGKASTIEIHLNSHYQYIFFHVKDDGCGFKPDERHPKGLGLKHVYERCKILGGDIRWLSKTGGPTRVEGFVSILKSEGETENEFNDCR